MRLVLSATQHGWHPAAWRMTGAPAFSAAAILDQARWAEEARLDAILFGLPPFAAFRPGDGTAASVRFDPLVLIGAAIATTRRIGLGGFWPLDVSEPFHVARVMATLDHLSGGRTAWITGLAGASALRADYGHARLLEDGAEAARRFSEFVDVAGKLWDSWEDRGFVADQASGMFVDPDHVHPILHEGEFFAVRGPLNVPRPIQGRPVVMHRDCGPGPLRDVAAAMADIVVAPWETIEAAAQLKAELRTTAGRSPARLDPPLLIASVMPVLAATEGEARRRAAELDAIEPGPGSRFVGTPAAFAAELVSWHDAGACDGFDLRPAVLPDDLDLIADGVLPRLRQRSLARTAYADATLRGHLALGRPESRFAT